MTVNGVGQDDGAVIMTGIENVIVVETEVLVLVSE